ncbi:aspartate aminotransferase family protein [Pseudogracilibacillus auburnensis]|uniref:glutamate-1-semialdehyde 2,1-aminomutase n=1 Tax=Pseudogracilibacillus auburnensis TaxID=1494959 RepID=A0A2V3W8M7_9BACI|nr:aspartate aminotransferase family protein [Pseudogracilibacillus auburnensis]PXW90390.1 glutamate-1-semialdehyde 2,1-aminomutase [Pseudogracilibacillus auburnensis]
MLNERSMELYKEANQYSPGGVHTSIRNVEPHLVFTKAEGAYIYDADGNKYLDFQAAFGPYILGHNYKKVNDRVIDALNRTDLYGVGSTDLEIECAKKITKHVPSAEQVLFCNSGSEATYHAIRLSRAVTERTKLIKFQGCYHGWHDYVARNMLSEPHMIGKRDPGSAGMMDEAIDNTLICTFNDLEDVERTFNDNKGEIAALIVEPIPHNIGCIMPEEGFLKGLRDLCDQNGTMLIFDEVITGFRHNIGGYQNVCAVTPDLTTMGKAMANGFPMAAVAGKKEYMQRYNTYPGGDVWFAGTYNGHAIGTAATIATMEIMETEPVHKHIFELGERMRQGIREIHDRLGIDAYVAGFGSVWTTYFMSFEPKNYTDLMQNDADLYIKYRKKLLERGFFKMPMNIKRNHISYSHTKEDIENALQAIEDVLKEII